MGKPDDGGKVRSSGFSHSFNGGTQSFQCRIARGLKKLQKKVIQTQHPKLPGIAADALAEGYAGPALRRLVMLANPIFIDIRNREIDSAFREMGVVAPIAKDEARRLPPSSLLKKHSMGDRTCLTSRRMPASTCTNSSIQAMPWSVSLTYRRKRRTLRAPSGVALSPISRTHSKSFC